MHCISLTDAHLTSVNDSSGQVNGFCSSEVKRNFNLTASRNSTHCSYYKQLTVINLPTQRQEVQNLQLPK